MSTDTSIFHTKIKANQILSVSNTKVWFNKTRNAFGKPQINFFIQNPTSQLPRGSIIEEMQTLTIAPDVQLFIKDASSPSRFQITITAPRSEKIEFAEAPRKTLFRKLPIQYDGGLYLHSMPGRKEALSQSLSEIYYLGISKIVCLAPLEEIKVKSELYADSIENGSLPCAFEHLPVADYAVPSDPSRFITIAAEVASSVEKGERILVHCAAGIGRTGTFAVAVLVSLGYSLEAALDTVKTVGSGPETSPQKDLLKAIAGMN